MKVRNLLTLPSAIFLAASILSSLASGFTKSGNEYDTNGTIDDAQAAINHASPGDIIYIPNGTFTWGAGGKFLNVNKAVTVSGRGQSTTIINIDPTASTWGNGVIRLSAEGAVARRLTINQSGQANTTAFTGGPANGWRITEITYNSASPNRGYFCYGGSYGLIDSCVLNGGGGSDELIFTRGPADSWQTPSSMGTANAVYIEDCVFNGSGYVSDFNANSRGVVRFNVINGQMKVDTHGVSTNTPARSGRHTEVYRNRWTVGAGAYYAAIEIRGGSGIIFDNVADNAGSSHWMLLIDYGYRGIYPNYGNGNVYGTPTWYPLKDQIGVGMDPKVAGSEPFYIVNNAIAGNDWIVAHQAIPDAAITQYRTETGNPNATFAMLDVISANKDYFKHTIGAAFDGSAGVGRGTKAQMLAVTGKKVGVGFWVTDEGEWDSTKAGPDGQLYVWNGTSWSFKYRPLAYPHPLRSSASSAPTSTPPSGAKIQISTN